MNPVGRNLATNSLYFGVSTVDLGRDGPTMLRCEWDPQLLRLEPFFLFVSSSPSLHKFNF